MGPGAADHFAALGMAQFRLGQHTDAERSLLRAANARSQAEGPHPAVEAFLALTCHALGRKEESAAALARLRQALEQPAWAADTNCRAWLREVEAALGVNGREK